MAADVVEQEAHLEEARAVARENGYSGRFPEREECLGLWHTNRRCWWGRYGKCDAPDFGAPRCLANELRKKA